MKCRGAAIVEAPLALLAILLALGCLYDTVRYFQLRAGLNHAAQVALSRAQTIPGLEARAGNGTATDRFNTAKETILAVLDERTRATLFGSYRVTEGERLIVPEPLPQELDREVRFRTEPIRVRISATWEPLIISALSPLTIETSGYREQQRQSSMPITLSCDGRPNLPGRPIECECGPDKAVDPYTGLCTCDPAGTPCGIGGVVTQRGDDCSCECSDTRMVWNADHTRCVCPNSCNDMCPRPAENRENSCSRNSYSADAQCGCTCPVGSREVALLNQAGERVGSMCCDASTSYQTNVRECCTSAGRTFHEDLGTSVCCQSGTTPMIAQEPGRNVIRVSCCSPASNVHDSADFIRLRTACIDSRGRWNEESCMCDCRQGPDVVVDGNGVCPQHCENGAEEECEAAPCHTYDRPSCSCQSCSETITCQNPLQAPACISDNGGQQRCGCVCANYPNCHGDEQYNPETCLCECPPCGANQQRAPNCGACSCTLDCSAIDGQRPDATCNFCACPAGQSVCSDRNGGRYCSEFCNH